MIAVLGAATLATLATGCATASGAQAGAFEGPRDELFGVVGQLAALTPDAVWDGQWTRPFSCVPEAGATESFAIWVTGTISDLGDQDRAQLAETFRSVLDGAGWNPVLQERPLRDTTFPAVTSDTSLNAASAGGDFGFEITFPDDPASSLLPDPAAAHFSVVSPCVDGDYRAAVAALEGSTAPWEATR